MNIPRLKLVRTLLALLALLMTAGVPASQDAGERVDAERWYIATLDGMIVGHMHERTVVRTDEAGIETAVISTSEMSFSLARVGHAIEIAVSSRVVESPPGTFERLETIQQTGGLKQRTRYEFGEHGEVTMVSAVGPVKQRQVLPAPDLEGVLTPSQIASTLGAWLDGDEPTLTYATIDATAGLDPVTIVSKRVGEGVHEIAGREVKAREVHSSVSVLPGLTTRELVDPVTHEPLRVEVPLGAFSIALEQTDEATATAEFEPAEIMAGSFVFVHDGLIKPRESRAAEFRIRATQGDLPDLPSVGAQRVERIADDTAMVRVDLDALAPVSISDEERAELLGRSTMIDPEDEAVLELARALGRIDADGTEAIAISATDLVAEHIEDKNLSFGLATSGEAARARAGDCTEHAVLLAAVLRARGVPSRVVTGLVYLPASDAEGFLDDMPEHADHAGAGLWGYHMWTQALVLRGKEGGGREEVWLDLDAAVTSPGRYDAGHIALGVLSFDEAEAFNPLLTTALVIGRLSIETAQRPIGAGDPVHAE